MYDLRSKLTRAAIYLTAVVALASIGMMFFVGEGGWISFLPFILAAVVFVLCFGLSFVPFIKDHMWLLVPLALLISFLTCFLIKVFVMK